MQAIPSGNQHLRTEESVVTGLLGGRYDVLGIGGCNWRWQKHGPEHMLFWATACVLSVLG
ncbi:hypothetical protein [Pseudomonas tumuqii]|uniref:hypothetical protein n=1 Tax=Pseudomonas tumuqii TaxID=2715755 RepID=UPI001553D7FD|nr:hypothetical protein [Pseudomonas tumuqii]